MRKLQFLVSLPILLLIFLCPPVQAEHIKSVNLETDADLFTMICDITHWNVPSGFEMEGFLRTDLNSDGITDAVVTLIRQSDNRRMLAVIMSDETGYRIVENDNALPVKGIDGDSFAGINAGADYIALYTQGNEAYSFENEYLFTRNGNDFSLKELSSTQWEASSGQGIQNIFNFETGQHVLVSGVLQGNDFVPITQDLTHDFSVSGFSSPLDTFGVENIPVTWEDFSKTAGINAEQSIELEPVEKIYCNACAKYFTTGDEFRNHQCVPEVQLPELVICEICEKQFIDDEAFLNHICIDQLAETIVCDICGLQFKQSDDYNTHVCVSYPEENLVYCDGCSQWYAEGEVFRDHVCTTPTGETEE